MASEDAIARWAHRMVEKYGPTLVYLGCDGKHRGPEGPCEDIAVCPSCGSISFSMRPPGECFGHHAPDCSLPERHESFCKPGGTGHKTGKLRGYPEFTWQSQP